MEDWYFIIRAGLVLAAVAGIAFGFGMLAGKMVWRNEKGFGEESGARTRRPGSKPEMSRSGGDGNSADET